MKEPFLEPILRRLRIRRIKPHLINNPDIRVLDIGCGWGFRFLKSIEPYIREGVGIDFKVPEIKTRKIETHAVMLDSDLPFPDGSFDVVTMLAVLEHLDNPLKILNEISRILKPRGKVFITVPSRYSKPILEFLAFKLGVISSEEIRDHKNYYNREDLMELISQTINLRVVEHSYFQFRFNNFLYLVRQS